MVLNKTGLKAIDRKCTQKTQLFEYAHGAQHTDGFVHICVHSRAFTDSSFFVRLIRPDLVYICPINPLKRAPIGCPESLPDSLLISDRRYR